MVKFRPAHTFICYLHVLKRLYTRPMLFYGVRPQANTKNNMYIRYHTCAKLS